MVRSEFLAHAHFRLSQGGPSPAGHQRPDPRGKDSSGTAPFVTEKWRAVPARNWTLRISVSQISLALEVGIQTDVRCPPLLFKSWCHVALGHGGCPQSHPGDLVPGSQSRTAV